MFGRVLLPIADNDFALVGPLQVFRFFNFKSQPIALFRSLVTFFSYYIILATINIIRVDDVLITPFDGRT